MTESLDRPLEQQITLLELVDRVLNKGVVLSGDIMLSVADVDLVYVGLRVLLASVGTLERLGQTFMKLEKRMEELKAEFDLEDSDLNLNLGPLGDLL